MQPDKIKLLTAQQVAALGPDKAAALADVCVEWGPFGDADRARAHVRPRAARARPAAHATARRRAAGERRTATMLVIRDPSTQAVARLRELAPTYPSADVKVGVCDKSADGRS